MVDPRVCPSGSLTCEAGLESSIYAPCNRPDARRRGRGGGTSIGARIWLARLPRSSARLPSARILPARLLPEHPPMANACYLRHGPSATRALTIADRSLGQYLAHHLDTPPSSPYDLLRRNVTRLPRGQARVPSVALLRQSLFIARIARLSFARSARTLDHLSTAVWANNQRSFALIVAGRSLLNAFRSFVRSSERDQLAASCLRLACWEPLGPLALVVVGTTRVLPAIPFPSER